MMLKDLKNNGTGGLTMADYIDREAVRNFLIDVPSDINEELTCTTDVLSGCAFRNSEILSFVNEMPSVDAVEVVRCKDCKWYQSVYGNCLRFSFKSMDDIVKYLIIVEKDFFCKWGEKE